MTHGRRVYSSIAKNKQHAPGIFRTFFLWRGIIKRVISESGAVHMSTLGTQASQISRAGDMGNGAGKDFVILCPADGLKAAISALYYLPRNYKLLVRDTADQAALAGMLQDDAYTNRVSFEQATETSGQDVSSSFADVVLQSGEEQPASLSQRIARRISLGDAATPEALASAILKAARA